MEHKTSSLLSCKMMRKRKKQAGSVQMPVAHRLNEGTDLAEKALRERTSGVSSVSKEYHVKGGEHLTGTQARDVAGVVHRELIPRRVSRAKAGVLHVESERRGMPQKQSNESLTVSWVTRAL